MFWLVWLPLSLIAFFIIVPQFNKNLKVWLAENDGVWLLVLSVIALVLVGLAINFTGLSPTKTVYPDLKNPVYLTQLPGNQDNKYLIYTEDLINGEEYILYSLNSETGIPKQITFSHGELRLVYDNPSRPFLAKILYTCKAKRFWRLNCNNPSPYFYELHLSTDSILK